MQVNPSDPVVLSGATSLHSVSVWDALHLGKRVGEMESR